MIIILNKIWENFVALNQQQNEKATRNFRAEPKRRIINSANAKTAAQGQRTDHIYAEIYGEFGYIVSASVVIAPHGHSATQMPQP